MQHCLLFVICIDACVRKNNDLASVNMVDTLLFQYSLQRNFEDYFPYILLLSQDTYVLWNQFQPMKNYNLLLSEQEQLFVLSFHMHHKSVKSHFVNVISSCIKIREQQRALSEKALKILYFFLLCSTCMCKNAF